ncbi:deoxyribonuclease IV [Hippea maritima]|uniref:Probable endonuclease 4 n=1 Tax=Hippea maritima (strain ATCC 700847 / DSM 10411 / MH2) TaxID=760142 RepID=F2LVR9_HIPMA|nr:deoxyribonuclease IV [Hippea maritima]AEA33853.1 endonuclease 4 [Hippea maritima DSM 10411]
MKFVGAHVSIAGGVQNALLNAKRINANAFALFTRNQRRWEAKPYTEKNIAFFKKNLKDFGFDEKYILPHASYLINLCSPKKDTLEKSRKSFIEELNRVKQLGLKYLNVHPGAHLNKLSLKESISLMAESINLALDSIGDITIVLEITAGEGTVVGYRFEHLAGIIEQVKDKKRIGVCLDTCHMFAAGYDIRDEDSYEKTMAEFDSTVGFSYLKGMHLNDSKHPLGSRKDRHESIGKGFIGLDAFKFIMKDPRTDNIPLILETPNTSLWSKEIELLRSFV